ncbi:MAG: hypothetical protein ACI4GV_09405 [Acutalibacteraceae bacterium]
MSEKTIENTDVPNIKDTKLTPEEHIEFLKKKLEEAERKATDSNIALIEMTAARNALYKSLQDTQLRLAETMSQRENDVEAYQKELELRLQEKRELQEKYDSLIIKAKRYDDLQESVVKIKMNAEVKAHTVIDEAQEKALDTVTLIDDIAKEINLFRDDITFLRRDIKIGTFTIDDRLENIYQRLCKNMNRLMKIKEDFYIQNSLPFDETDNLISEGNAPVINYPENLDTNDIKKD